MGSKFAKAWPCSKNGIAVAKGDGVRQVTWWSKDGLATPFTCVPGTTGGRGMLYFRDYILLYCMPLQGAGSQLKALPPKLSFFWQLEVGTRDCPVA